MGLSRRRLSGAPPNSKASSCETNENPTVSTKPRAAKIRRARAARACLGVRATPGTTLSAGKGTAGTLSSPFRRKISSTKSLSASHRATPSAALAATAASSLLPCASTTFWAMSLRHDGTLTRTACAVRSCTSKPSFSSRLTLSSAVTSNPPRSRTRSKRRVASRCHLGCAPPETTSLASPPHTSSIIRVAASSAAIGRAWSTPRSKR